MLRISFICNKPEANWLLFHVFTVNKARTKDINFKDY